MKRPHISLNLAVSADGKITSANRAIASFGSARDIAHLYRLRANADAILCGARTVDTHEVTLDNGGVKFDALRKRNGRAPHPVRVIVSGSGSLKTDARVFQSPAAGPLIVVVSTRAKPRVVEKLRRQVHEVYQDESESIDFAKLAGWLKTKHRVERLLCEGGGELNDALFRADLVDAIHLTWCPLIIGGRAAPTLSDGIGISALADARRFQLVSRRRVGDELFLRYARATQSATGVVSTRRASNHKVSDRRLR